MGAPLETITLPSPPQRHLPGAPQTTPAQSECSCASTGAPAAAWGSCSLPRTPAVRCPGRASCATEGHVHEEYRGRRALGANTSGLHMHCAAGGQSSMPVLMGGNCKQRMQRERRAGAPAHVAQDDPCIVGLLGRPACTQQQLELIHSRASRPQPTGSCSRPCQARSRQGSYSVLEDSDPGCAQGIACTAAASLQPSPADWHHPPRSVLRRSSTQSPGALPCHAHF